MITDSKIERRLQRIERAQFQLHVALTSLLAYVTHLQSHDDAAYLLNAAKRANNLCSRIVRDDRAPDEKQFDARVSGL